MLFFSSSTMRVSITAHTSIISHCHCYHSCPSRLHQMSCNGLEEYLQLLIKWQAWVEVFMPPGWEGRSSFKVLQELPPGRRYSRLHMPQVC